MGNTKEKKQTKTKVAKKTNAKKKKKVYKIHLLTTVVAVTLVIVLLSGIVAVTKGIIKDYGVKSNLEILSLFDNEVTKQSSYLYLNNNTADRLILHTTLKKENKNKKVYDLKIYKGKEYYKGEIIQDLELVVDKEQIKVGPTVLYKANLKPEETFITNFNKAKNKKAEVKIVRETALELVVELKYTDKEDKEIIEKITMEKLRGIVKIETSNSGELNLVKTYFKLPQGITWDRLFEDYMAE